MRWFKSDTTINNVNDIEVGSVLYDKGFSRNLIVFSVDLGDPPCDRGLGVLYTSHRGHGRIAYIDTYELFSGRFDMVIK